MYFMYDVYIYVCVYLFSRVQYVDKWKWKMIGLKYTQVCGVLC